MDQPFANLVAGGLAHACKNCDERARRVAALFSAFVHALLAGAVLWAGHAVYSETPRLAGHTLELLWSASAAATTEAAEETAVLVTPTTAQVDRRPFVRVPPARLRPPSAATPMPAPAALPPSELWRRELLDAAPPVLPPPPAELAPRSRRSLASTPHVPELLPGHEDVQAPTPRSAAPPTYPDEARRRGWQGRVLLRAHVSAEGRVTAVDVVQSSGYAVLDAAAATAVRGWVFHPARRGDRAVPCTVRVPVEFEL